MRNLAKKSSIVGLMLLLTLSLSAQQGNGQGRQQGKKGQNSQQCQYQNKGERMTEYLELSTEQKEKIDALKLDHQKKMLPLKNELGEKQAKMQTLKTADHADMKAINGLIDEMAVIKTKMAKDRAALHQEMRKVLTDEQRLKFDMHAGKRGGKGHGHGHGKKCQG